MSNNLNLARLSNILADIKSRRDSDIASKVSETEFAAHVNDDDSHITNAERNSWTSKAEGTHTHSAADIPELADLISTTNTNYNDLSAEIANHTTQIASLGSNISDINDDIYDINEAISTINNNYNDLSAEVANHTTQIASLGSSVSAIDQTVSDHTTELAALTTQVAENQANIETLLEDTAEIDETTINNLLTDVFGE